MRDLQRRLRAAGHDPGEADRYGQGTSEAVLAFQAARGLPGTGECDALTWSVLVEAGWSLGDRPLYLRSPMMRGDDVAELQRKLGGLGFDAGRVDGIFGPDTEAALADFQRNVGLTSDGVCGRATLAELLRLGSRSLAAPVAAVREHEALRRSPQTLRERRVVLAHPGGLDALCAAITRRLRARDASVLVVERPDGSEQAHAANEFEAHVVLGLQVGAPPQVAYYSAVGFESAGGRRLAQLVAEAMPGGASAPLGMRLPLLRETRAPAVLCQLGAVHDVVTQTQAYAAALSEAVAEWVRSPVSA